MASVVLIAITWRVKVKNLQVALDERLHQRLKRVAADRSETLANLIREAVSKFVDQHEQHQSQQIEEDK